MYIFFSPKKYIEPSQMSEKKYIYIFYFWEKNIYIYIFRRRRKNFLGKNRVFVNNFDKNPQISEKIYIYIFFQNSQVSNPEKYIYIYIFYFGKNIYIYIFFRKKYIGKSLIPGLFRTVFWVLSLQDLVRQLGWMPTSVSHPTNRNRSPMFPSGTKTSR